MKAHSHIKVIGPILLALAGCDRQAGTGANVVREAMSPSRSAPSVELTGWVTDAADILSSPQEQSISAKLERFEQKTSHQLVVVTVPTLAGKDVADFTRDLANAWGIGREGHDDGVVLLVAPNVSRIAVGYGLETVLPNALCQQIMNEEITPRFERGDLPGGIEAGVDALISKLQ